MKKSLVTRYPLVSATVLISIVTVSLFLSPASYLSVWVASVYSLVIAGRSALSMLRSLRSGTWGIDILAVTAIVSTVALGDFWAALVVVLMLTSGEALEDFASHRARSELTSLMDRAPRVAHLADRDIEVDEVRPGDEIDVHPGEIVPVDAVIIEGVASLDESSITGESLPVMRELGSEVLSGAVNGGSAIKIRATSTAGTSQYETIVALVRAAADSRAPFVRLADRVAIPFTIVAFAIGGLAWLLSGDPVTFAEVLVVATPCPLLIATPVAFIAGMSRAAGQGIIVKHGGVLEQLSRVRTAAFDKTGTLTLGAPTVDRIDSNALSETDILQLAASIEADSAHVLAKAVVYEAHRRDLPLLPASGVREIVAQGAHGLIDGSLIAVGKLSFAAPRARNQLADLAAGETAVHVSRNGQFVGRIVLTDEIRPETPATLSRLRSLGVGRAVMLTGDARDTAAKISDLAGIDDTHAGLLPTEKVDAIRRLSPSPVMMVGDGVNDAPVLAAADVGIAMGARGATAASESADVVILVDELGRVADLVEISQRTIRIASQSIGIGIGMSLALMVIASTGIIPAIVGAALQEVVDVVTIINSLRAGVGGPARVADPAPPSRLRASRSDLDDGTLGPNGSRRRVRR